MIHCLITARLSSERLPGKALLDLDGIPVVEHVMRRCEHFGFIPILCCPVEDQDEIYEAVSFTEVFGYSSEVEELVISCAHEYKLDAFHHLDGDDPFFDEYAVIDSYQSALIESLARVTPSYNSETGSGRVGTTYNLKAQKAESRRLLQRMNNFPWPQRLTLDYPEDYQLICAVNRIVGGYMAPRSVVDDAFVRNPDLHRINWHRNADWKEKQRREKSRPRVRDSVLPPDRE